MASSSASSATLATNRTIRDYYLEHVRKRFPQFKPRNDFDLLALGDGRYKGPETGVYAWLDQELALQVTLEGDASPALEAATRMLSAKGVVTGVSQVICVLAFLRLHLCSGNHLVVTLVSSFVLSLAALVPFVSFPALLQGRSIASTSSTAQQGCPSTRRSNSSCGHWALPPPRTPVHPPDCARLSARGVTCRRTSRRAQRSSCSAMG